ncbi:hypothetical protein ACIBAI_01515 [Streptomyces sp. NPDC051041]
MNADGVGIVVGRAVDGYGSDLVTHRAEGGRTVLGTTGTGARLGPGFAC